MRIGIIGGGQLGMMMAESAIKHGHEIISLDPNPNCSISRYATKHLSYDYNDKKGINEIIEESDVLTYEFENVNASVIKEIEDKLPQKTTALKISQNRLKEKDLAKKLNIPTPSYTKYENEKSVFYPSVIKTTSGGYDGKGQSRLMNSHEFKAEDFDSKYEYIVEELIQFDYEISCIGCRDNYNQIVYYPIPLNVHKNGILFTSTVTNKIPEIIQDKAREYTKRIMEELDYIGTLAVEFFIKDMEVIFNEFAPRPHNSGHYTIEGCNVSQFENHILAITNEHVIKPILLKNSIMINVLGQNIKYYELAKNLDNVYIHDYFKSECRNNRKMGHITITCDTYEECIILKRRILEK